MEELYNRRGALKLTSCPQVETYLADACAEGSHIRDEHKEVFDHDCVAAPRIGIENAGDGERQIYLF